jgi:glycosyltransferase involved in cell wall biosynthesis
LRRYLLDATALLDPPAGIPRLVAELTSRIPARLADDETLVVAARVHRRGAVDESALVAVGRSPRVEVARLALPSGLAALDGRILPWSEIDLRCAPVDVVHGPDFALPRVRGARSVVTIHDLAFLALPETVPEDFRRTMEQRVRDAVARADVVVAVSETTAREVEGLLGVPRARIEVIRPGVEAAFLAARVPEADRRALAGVGVTSPYVLCVATTHPRKNHLRLLQAMATLRARGLPHRLVLVGQPGFAEDEVRAAIDRGGFGETVLRLASVAEPVLAALLRGADAVVLPSLAEGVGLPILEGMAAGRPVVTSRGGGTEETAGDAAVLVDPTSVDDLAGGIERALTDAELRERLAVAGPARARSFSWDACAGAHVELWRRLAAG